MLFELATQCVANWKGYIMARFELIDGEEERQFYKDARDILENARNNAYIVANDIMTYA